MTEAAAVGAALVGAVEGAETEAGAEGVGGMVFRKGVVGVGAGAGGEEEVWLVAPRSS